MHGAYPRWVDPAVWANIEHNEDVVYLKNRARIDEIVDEAMRQAERRIWSSKSAYDFNLLSLDPLKSVRALFRDATRKAGAAPAASAGTV
jgi:hypothetical protein